jgi:hypothetical protein
MVCSATIHHRIEGIAAPIPLADIVQPGQATIAIDVATMMVKSANFSATLSGVA